MAEQIVVTLRAERGAKYDTTGECIGSHNRSIVFMPRSVKPDQVVRVRLFPIDGKMDRNNRQMYRAELAPLRLSMACQYAMADEARELRQGQAFPREQGQAILRAKGFAGVDSYSWYYFCSDQIFGSTFSPAALTALEFLPQAAGPGFAELIAWVAETGYYSATQERGEARTPDVPESALIALQERARHHERVLSVDILAEAAVKFAAWAASQMV